MNFWKRKWENKMCGITQTRLRPGKNKRGRKYVIFLDCKHGYYRSALIEWIKYCPTERLSCPVCRKEFYLNVLL